MAARRLLLWLHVVTSVGWMSQALSLVALLGYGSAAGDPGTRLDAYRMAEVLDTHVLLYLADTSAFTGVMLAALTPWGFFVYWWVLAKFAITLSQLALGIALLSPNLAAAAAGPGAPVPGLVAPSLLMVSAIGVQAWLSVAKPWRRTPWAAGVRLAAGPRWMFWYAVAVPVADYLIGTFVLGFPMIGLSLLTAVGYPVRRAIAGRIR